MPRPCSIFLPVRLEWLILPCWPGRWAGWVTFKKEIRGTRTGLQTRKELRRDEKGRCSLRETEGLVPGNKQDGVNSHVVNQTVKSLGEKSLLFASLDYADTMSAGNHKR
ncbi:hypothetical protein AMECASPLE_002456 [Ameca splendens]|uniref:Secreted protein n=1 Tax=Ameca splendens TaxID=208324 RepID=A0ABV0XY52_9TELE